MWRLIFLSLVTLSIITTQVSIAADPSEELRALILKPLKAWERKEPIWKQISCDSKKLQEAKAHVGVAERSAGNRYGDYLDMNMAVGGATLDVAEAALKHGCLDVADEMYRHVLQRYVGIAYSGLRQRAQVGINDVRSRKQDQ